MALASNSSTSSTSSSNGLLVLEKDLVCSICTEVLYQPLTVLDCLHTFCGSCLKEWFTHQHRKATSSRSASSSSTSHPYTCPTCRSPARDVQRFSVINNFLENFLAANPDRDRSATDKEDMRAMYRPGENILPKIERRRGDRRTRREEHDLAIRERHMIEEARERSLRDMEAAPHRNQNTLSPPDPGRARSSSHEREERRQRRRERERHRELHIENNRPLEESSSTVIDTPPISPPSISSPRHPDAIEARHREQRMAHQASLRSLVSVSESGTGSNDSLDEARVMQEILSQGLLDGIDVDVLTEAEQDALANRIAEAYRQRHSRASITSSPPQQETRVSNSGQQLEPQTHLETPSHEDRRRRSSERQRAGTTPSPVRPEPSRDEPVPRRTHPPPSAMQRSNSSVTISHRRRTSDQSQSGNAGRVNSRRSSPDRNQAISRSATDLSAQQQTMLTSRSRGNSASSRHTTDPRQVPRASETWLQASSDGRRAQPNAPTKGPSPNQSPKPIHLQLNNGTIDLNSSSPSHVHSVEPTPSSQRTPGSFDEPSISCFRCLRHDIHYELHKHCRVCQVDLCLDCYRKQEGCNHWLGFGRAADAKYDLLKQTEESTAPPHILTSRQYQHPLPSTVLQSRPSPKRPQPIPSRTTSNPADRLQEGHFCDRCGSFANEEFWICDECNDGEWGFCHSCVMQHHCCKHQLLAVKYTPPSVANRNDGSILLRPASPLSTTSNRSVTKNSDFGYDNMTISVDCDNCSRSIEPIEPRFHCPSHPTPAPNDPGAQGDYDLCTTCYFDLVRSYRLRREDGPDGWRKCPDGHRMIILAFEADYDDEEGAMRRVVKQDLVGGWKMSEADIQAWTQARIQQQAATSLPGSASATSPPLPGMASRGTWSWRDDPSTNRRTTRSRVSSVTQYATSLRFPPDGGFGTHALALYSYYPEEGDEGAGELMFPRQGDISEIEKVNEDWWSGVYAGDIGYLPSGYVKETK